MSETASKTVGGRHWQSVDMSVSKIVLIEGDMTQECGKFGSTIKLILDEQNFGEHDIESIFIRDRSKMSLSVRIGLAFTELDLSLEQAALSMYPGEKSRFDVSAPVGEKWITLHYVATTWDKSDSISVCQWTCQQKLQFAQESFEVAVELVRNKEYQGAFKMFRQTAALTMFIRDTTFESQAKDLKQRSFSNLTLCQKNMNNYQHVVDGVNHILDDHNQDLDNNKIKLLARRGQAHIKLQNYEKAIEDLSIASAKDLANKTVQADLKQAKHLLRTHEAKLGNAMKKMFG